MNSEEEDSTISEPMAQRGLIGKIVGGLVGGPIGAIAGNYIEDKIKGKNKEKEDEDEQKKKRSSGSCGGGTSQGDQSSDSVPKEMDDDEENESEDDEEKEDEEEEEEDEDELVEELDALQQVDDSTNDMCKKTYTVFRAIKQNYKCPVAQRDNVADQFTPQDDLITMEKTVRDFLKLEGKIYDPESTNPRFFASEQWVQHYEKDKNVVLAALDQFRTNILRMEHLYTVVDNNSYSKLLTIPGQDCKEKFQANILWTARALKDWANNWFIKRNPWSSTPMFSKDYWLPGLTGQMVQWMKLGTWNEPDTRAVSIETMIRKVDMLDGAIDRLMSSDAVADAISTSVNLKEVLEQKADQKSDGIFTTKVIDSQMGQKLGVTSTKKDNSKPDGTKYRKPDPDDVESVKFANKVGCVKKLFKELREKAMDALKRQRAVSTGGNGPYPQIWSRIDDLAKPVYRDLEIMNELIEDKYQDYENPGRHCSITHAPLDPSELKLRIATFKSIIERGVVDVMTNQAQLPKKGLNILDSMFNQLWEYGEKGPTIELPTWCEMAIDSINSFESSMIDAWNHVFDCWEREFATRLWDVEVDHHTSNWERTQTRYVRTVHNHQHPFVPLTMMTLASIGGDTKNSDITPLKGVLTCPGHLEKLMNPVCIQYRVFNIAHLARNYMTNVKSLCQWMEAAIQAVGVKMAAISAVMSDPTLNGECGNVEQLDEINQLRDRNNILLEKVEKAYGIYSDVQNLKNKKEYDEEIALHELMPSKLSNEDQLNMSSSIQTETDQSNLDAELCEGGIDIEELKPWNHLELSDNKVEAKKIPVTKACNKFGKIIQSMSGFETAMSMKEQ